jgi:hypothetical protein
VETLNWAGAIAKNRDALVRIVTMLFSIAGLDGREVVETLPRVTRNYLYRILRPAESAVRRLIVIAARNMSADVHPTRSVILGLEPRTHSEKDSADAKTDRTSAFPLLDPLKKFSFAPPKRYATTMPRVRSLSGWSLPVYLRQPEPPARREPSPDDPVSATSLCRRLRRLKRALDDLDGQAKRFARWRARRDMGRTKRFSPLRPGRPPGHRKRPLHEVDEVLRECHSLALYAQRDDTS